MYLPQMAVSTSDMNNITYPCRVMGYQKIHMTSQRTGNNETKAYPTIRICQLITLTGDCLSWNVYCELCSLRLCEMPERVINPKPARVREMTLNIQ